MNRTEKKIDIISSILGINAKELENILKAPALHGSVGSALTNQLSGLQENIEGLPYFSLPTSDTAHPNGQVKVFDSGSQPFAPVSGKTLEFTIPWRNLTSMAQFWCKVNLAGDINNHWALMNNQVGWGSSNHYGVTINYVNDPDHAEGSKIFVEIPYASTSSVWSSKYGNATTSPVEASILNMDRYRLIVVEYGEISNQGSSEMH